MIFFIFACSFLVLIFILGYFNRLAADDYGYMYYNDLHGVLGSVATWYKMWSGRWTNNFLTALFVEMFKNGGSLIIHAAITVFLLIFSIYVLLKKLTIHYFKLEINRLEIFLFSIIYCASFFFLTFNVGDSWFWLAGSHGFLWSLIALNFGVASIISERLNLQAITIIAISFLYIGGSNEGYAASFLIIMIVFGIFSYKKIIGNNAISIKLLLALTFLGISFLITFIAPGNDSRRGEYPDPSLINALFETWSSVKHLLKIELPVKTGYYVLSIIPWMILGNNFENNMSIRKLYKFIGLGHFGFTMFLFIALFPPAYAISGTGPERLWTQISFALAITGAFTGFSIGRYLQLTSKQFNIVGLSGIMIFTGVIFYHIFTQYPVVSNYARHEDKRIEALKKHKAEGRKDELIIHASPPSGFLKMNEMDEDSTKAVKLGLGLDFVVRVAREE